MSQIPGLDQQQWERFFERLEYEFKRRLKYASIEVRVDSRMFSPTGIQWGTQTFASPKQRKLAEEIYFQTWKELFERYIK